MAASPRSNPRRPVDSVIDRRLTVLVAPDSFKGTLTSVEVARALGDGWRRARPADTVVFAPLADGGEGTLAAIEASGGWEVQTVEAMDPIGRRLDAATWLLSSDGRHAVLEMAQASGLSLVSPEHRDAVHAMTLGTGQLIGAALDAEAHSITLGIGGSATSDGGRGMLVGLGAQDWDDLDLERLDARLGEVDFAVACDVTNPLLGERGAAAVYGPQKGATPDQVRMIEGGLEAWADRLEAASGRYERDTPGAGAAGGVGFALLCIQDRFRSFALRPGVDLVMEATGFDEKLAAADLVITGEGRIDAQTAFGKTALGVARRAQAAGVPCIAVGGGVQPEGVAALAEVGATALPVWEAPVALEVALAAGAEPLVRCGERLARLVGSGAIAIP
jgi:glycerate kinase